MSASIFASADGNSGNLQLNGTPVVTFNSTGITSGVANKVNLFTANQRPNYANTDTLSATGSFTYDGNTKPQVNLITLTNAITVTFANPTNIVEGAMYLYLLKAGDASARIFAWGTAYQNNPPVTGTTNVGKTDVLSFIGGPSNTLIYIGGSFGA